LVCVLKNILIIFALFVNGLRIGGKEQLLRHQQENRASDEKMDARFDIIVRGLRTTFAQTQDAVQCTSLRPSEHREHRAGICPTNWDLRSPLLSHIFSNQ